MKKLTAAAIALIVIVSRTTSADDHVVVKPVSAIHGLPARIAFGSCAKQTKPQPILKTIVDHKPDLFIYLGDNIYGDTRDMSVLKAKYDQLAAKPLFQSLRENVAVLSTWDDHDYGENDAGREYPMKNQSREMFFDFWKVPEDSPRRRRPGIYGVHRFEQAGRALQVILLDTRFFRDPLKRNPKNLRAGSPFKNDYQPDPSVDKSILGEAQWRWLEARFREPADVRIVCSSIQFAHEYNGWESWNNLPYEQQKMFDLIRDTRANGVIFVSGDVHWGEISVRQQPGMYPIHDVTASGLTEDWHTIEPNRFRYGNPVRKNHFGLIEFDWKQPDVQIDLQLVDLTGARQNTKRVTAKQLSQ